MQRYAIRPAHREELPAVLEVQRRAFTRVATQFALDPATLPPLVESEDELRARHEEGVRFYVAVGRDAEIVGSVRASERSGIVEIGRLVVDDGWLRMGVATKLMEYLEADHPRAAAFSVFTGEEASEPLALYEKLGYSIVRRDVLDAYVLVWLEKPGPAQ